MVKTFQRQFIYTGGGLSYDGEDPHGDIAKGLRHGHAKTFLSVLVPELIPRFDRRMPVSAVVLVLELILVL
jgi:hypothetical protein